MKKTYKIDVDCANCANKMEQAIKKLPDVEDASINFMMQKLIIEFSEGAEPSAVIREVLASCKKIERGCEIYL